MSTKTTEKSDNGQPPAEQPEQPEQVQVEIYLVAVSPDGKIRSQVALIDALQPAFLGWQVQVMQISAERRNGDG